MSVLVPDSQTPIAARDVNGVNTGLTGTNPTRTYFGGPTYQLVLGVTGGLCGVYVDFGGLSTATNVWQGFAGQLKEIPASDYSILTMRTAANPYGIQWHNNAQTHWYNYPIFIYGRRSYIDTVRPRATS